MRSKRPLNVTQVKSNQSVREKHRGNATRAPKPVYRSFAYLQDFGELMGRKVFGAFVLWLVLRLGAAGLLARFGSFGRHYFLTGSNENDNGTASDSFTSTSLVSVL